MPYDMLRTICAAENESQQYIYLVKQKSQAALDAVHETGERAIESTLIRAQSEIAHLLRASDQKATEQARELASQTANKLATQRARAEKRLEAAAQLIVERIVND
ncbi:MAG: hypothetical protein FWB75_05890 [Oscillospiraceae bacterium]|nr:hypothetical protein [Oscillospiraceae bacterium]